jgi:chorismate mutase
MERTLEGIRDEIERMDRALIELLSCRLRVALDIETIKRERCLPIRSPEREQNELAMVLAYAQTLEPTLDGEFLTQLMTLIFAMSVAQQELQRVRATEYANK